MGIIVDDKSVVLVQGMTGREGRKATKEMMQYGTKVSCGVTPGKGSQVIEGMPIFDSVKEAMAYDPKLNTSVLYVPPHMVLDACMEAMTNGIKIVVVVTENVPIKDTSKIIEVSRQQHCRLIGPSSIGIINVGVAKLGSIGGARERDM